MYFIEFNSYDEKSIKQFFLYWLEQGFVLKKAYIKKKYIIFGKEKYYVEMEIGTIGYKMLIEEAMNKEDYLEVARLKKEYEQLNILNFK